VAGRGWLAEISPTGHVPVLVDNDGFCLPESHAIMKYMLHKAPASTYAWQGWYPQTHPRKAAVVRATLRGLGPRSVQDCAAYVRFLG
jgi:glutathione S-transferase